MEDDIKKFICVNPKTYISIHVPRVEDVDDELFRKLIISIHVPRVEDDAWDVSVFIDHYNFNPRPPCGGRPKPLSQFFRKRFISIHVPRVEDDDFLR